MHMVGVWFELLGLMSALIRYLNFFNLNTDK